MKDELPSLLAENESLRMENARLRRAQAERASHAPGIERTQRLCETLVNSIDGIVWEADAESFVFTFVSPQAERLLGYPLAQWTEERTFWVDHIHPDDREWVTRHCAECTKNLRDHAFEYRFIAADGRTVWLSERVTVTARDGRAVSLHGVALDITERKRAIEALRESEERYRQFADAVESVFWITDAATARVLYVNPAFERVWGKSIDTADDWLESVHPDDRGRMLEWSFALRETPPGMLHSVDYRIIRPDGQVRWIHDRALAMPGSLENARIAGIAEDVTDRKQAEQELCASREGLRALAEHLLSVREEERALISREIHDQLGQGLTALKMDVAWIMRRLPPDLGAIEGRARAMSESIDEIVRVVQRISTELRPSSLDDLGLVAAIEWQAQEFETRTGVRCVVNADWEEEARGDVLSISLFRIVQEALTNVTRHAHARTVKVDLYENDGLVVLTVSDDGRGMPAEILADPTAIGLTGMRERAELLSGKLTITSQPGRGTTVHVAIPLMDNPSEELA